jgi:hypothetical protein
MHKDLGHFGEERTLAEVCRRYFWHNRTEDVKVVVRVCQQCQMVKRMGSIRSEDEELKNIPVCDLFYRVAMDTTGPLPETKSGNRSIRRSGRGRFPTFSGRESNCQFDSRPFFCP